jgi:large subunit ribosomal protein L24
MKLKRNDKVIVLTGKDRNKTGVIERVFVNENKAVVKGLNLYKKSIKPSKKSPKGGIIEISAKINISNLGSICPSCSKISRVAYRNLNNKKIRICRKCDASLEVAE